MFGPLKNLFGGGRGGPDPRLPGGPTASRPSSAARGTGLEAVNTRPSRGLEEFFGYIRNQSGLTILDMGGASQENVTFITNLGHRLYSEDFLQSLKQSFGVDDTVDQSNPGRIEHFLEQALNYPDEHFDGVLIWDALEYLEPPLLNAVMDRLQRIVRPKSYLLAFFHADDKLDVAPFYAFRIEDTHTLQVTQYGKRKPTQLFNNRGLEKLFGRFESVKFFLAKDRLREVIVKV